MSRAFRLTLTNGEIENLFRIEDKIKDRSSHISEAEFEKREEIISELRDIEGDYDEFMPLRDLSVRESAYVSNLERVLEKYYRMLANRIESDEKLERMIQNMSKNVSGAADRLKVQIFRDLLNDNSRKNDASLYVLSDDDIAAIINYDNLFSSGSLPDDKNTINQLQSKQLRVMTTYNGLMKSDKGTDLEKLLAIERSLEKFYQAKVRTMDTTLIRDIIRNLTVIKDVEPNTKLFLAALKGELNNRKSDGFTRN